MRDDLGSVGSKSDSEERGSRLSGGGGSGSSPPPMDQNQIDVVLIGGPGVGKTAIVEQFARCQLPNRYRATTKPCIYTSAVIANEQIYEMNIVDMPVIPYSPLDGRACRRAAASCTWDELQSYANAIGTASVLIFVYDITAPESFQYIKDLREHILECFETDSVAYEVPMIVVGNKQDLQRLSRVPRRHISQMVRKTWKCSYIECSAKFNWHIASLFNEVVRVVTVGGNNKEGQSSAYRIPLRAWRQCGACSIM